ncbi:hypothetical protein [Shimia isoporae]|uniref:hypothetical protein n=1 Tax=Shimia isoporae TaxID=647720 RepID=UPI0010511C13|nr:hypothetical protein [Shimia isoporae]
MASNLVANRFTGLRGALGSLLADPDKGIAQDRASNANNPLANVTAFNLQNDGFDGFTGASNETGNQFVLRYAQPISFGGSQWLLRASLPHSGLPDGTGGGAPAVESVI